MVSALALAAPGCLGVGALVSDSRADGILLGGRLGVLFASLEL